MRILVGIVLAGVGGHAMAFAGYPLTPWGFIGMTCILVGGYAIGSFRE